MAVGLICTSLLPAAHRRFGVARTYLAGELAMAACLAASPLLGRARPYATLAVLGAGGAGWAVHNTSAFVLCRMVVRAPRAVAFFVSIVCTTCAVAQLLVGGLSGLLVQACGGSLPAMFAWAGAAVAVMHAGIWLASERDGFFPRSAATTEDMVGGTGADDQHRAGRAAAHTGEAGELAAHSEGEARHLLARVQLQ